MRDPRADAERLATAWDALLVTLGGPPPDVEPGPGHDQDECPGKIPVTVLSGFLGAGKTTLLCQLLESASTEIVAIVNDVASVNVDAALVRSTNAETIELQNGCACCVLGSDLREALERIGSRARRPAAVVIETSGLSDPIGIAQTVANTGTMTLDGIVTVVDGLAWQARAADPVTAPLFERQLAAAHLIVMTKTADLDDVCSHRAAIGRLAPGRPVLLADASEATPEVLLGAGGYGARPAVADAGHSQEGFAVATLAWRGSVDAGAFCRLMDGIPDAVYRLKGWVWLQQNAPGPSQRFELQAAGPRWRLLARNGQDQASELVAIGRASDPVFDGFLGRLRVLGGNGATRS